VKSELRMIIINEFPLRVTTGLSSSFFLHEAIQEMITSTIRNFRIRIIIIKLYYSFIPNLVS